MKVATDLPRVHFLNTSCRKFVFTIYSELSFKYGSSIINISNGKMWPRACQVSTDHLMSPVLYVLGHGFLFMNRESRKMSSRDFENHVPMWVVGLLGSFKSEHLGDSFAFPTSYTT